MVLNQEKLNKNEVKKGYIETPIKTIFTKFAKNKDVTLVYGEPIELGLKKVVPVAKVKYAVGGGGDGSGGEGGGGAFTVKPVGVFEITPDNVRFLPISNGKRIAVGAILSLGLLYFLKNKK